MVYFILITLWCLLKYLTMRLILLLLATALSCISCVNRTDTSSIYNEKSAVEVDSVLPITGTFLNLPYQDVRNKYTNPLSMDYTDPAFWEAKVSEMHKMVHSNFYESAFIS